MKYYLIAITSLSMLWILTSCADNQKDENTNQGIPAVDNYDRTYDAQVQDSSCSQGSSLDNTCQDQEMTTSTSTYTPTQPIMDDHEDAYEEALSLKEEDRLNNTRSHEGDDYDDDYNDDYDEGYDE